MRREGPQPANQRDGWHQSSARQLEGVTWASIVKTFRIRDAGRAYLKPEKKLSIVTIWLAMLENLGSLTAPPGFMRACETYVQHDSSSLIPQCDPRS